MNKLNIHTISHYQGGWTQLEGADSTMQTHPDPISDCVSI